MLPALNEIADSQSRLTFQTKLATDMVLVYAHKYPNANIHYHARDMVLHVKSDAAYCRNLLSIDYQLNRINPSTNIIILPNAEQGYRIIKMKDCLRSPQSSRQLHTYVKLK